MTRRLPALIALPAMAVVIAVISGFFYDWGAVSAEGNAPRSLSEFLLVSVLSEGPVKLASAMIYAAFGSVLSQMVMRTGIANRLISLTAEYSGENRFRLAALLTVIVAVCFSSVTGLGAVIMIGSLVLPILIGTGLSATYCVCLMLFAIAWGGIFNPAVLGFYIDTLKVDPNVMHTYVVAYGIMMGLATLAYFAIQGYKERRSFNWSAPAPAVENAKSVPLLALFTPLIPIALILTLNMPIIPAFLVGILWGAFTSRAGSPVSLITASTLEGLKDVSPVLGLFMGIGMALNAMMAEPTKAVLTPFLQAVVPTHPLPFVLFFVILAPLALYRGPLNFYGLGAGIAGLLLGTQILPGVAIMAAFFAVGQLQGVCDPTNTHNVWLGQFAKVNTGEIVKQTLPYVWGFAALALIWAVYFQGALN